MRIKHRRYIHIDVNEEGTIMALIQTRDNWESRIGPGTRVGKVVNACGDTAIFFTSHEVINYRIAMGVAGAFARHCETTWDIPF